MSNKKKSKKYRRGIEVGKSQKFKIKKSDLLRRIELLEEALKTAHSCQSCLPCEKGSTEG
jgi:hypothetical protein